MYVQNIGRYSQYQWMAKFKGNPKLGRTCYRKLLCLRRSNMFSRICSLKFVEHNERMRNDAHMSFKLGVPFNGTTK